MARHGIKKPAGAIDIHGAEKTDEMSSQREQVWKYLGVIFDSFTSILLFQSDWNDFQIFLII